MPVYAIQAGENGPVKLGMAADPIGRMADLQIGNHERLRLLRVWHGGVAEEASLHLRFADLHRHGEWFNFSRALLGDVGLVEILPEVVDAPPLPPPPPIISRGVTFAEWMAAQPRGTLTKLARDLDVRINTLHGWVAAKRSPPAHMIARIESVTEGMVCAASFLRDEAA